MTNRLLVLALFFATTSAAWAQSPAGPEFRVNTYTFGKQYRSAVASDANGNFVVVWVSDFNTGGGGIFGQRFDASGIPHGGEFRVGSSATTWAENPAVASDANGNFVVVWGNYNTSYDVYGRRFDASGVSLGSEFRVNSVPSDYAMFPAVASDASGNVVVAWKRALPAGNFPRWGVFGQRVDASGVPQGGEFQVNSSVPQSQGSAGVVSNPTGNFVVVWSGDDGSGSGIFGRRFNASGVPEGTEFQVNTYTTSSQSDPAVASNASGDFIVVWASNGQDGSEGGIFGQRFDASGLAQGGEFRVNSYTPGAQGYPSVASASNGGFVVVWPSLDQDGSSWGIFGQRFDAFGVPRGRGFRVNSYTPSWQGDPAVASDVSGDFVVVWTSYPQDGSADGIFGQRFSDLIFKDGFE